MKLTLRTLLPAALALGLSPLAWCVRADEPEPAPPAPPPPAPAPATDDPTHFVVQPTPEVVPQPAPQPVPAPAPDDQPVKPGKPTKPVKPAQVTGQTLVGVIQAINPKQGTIAIRPTQAGTAIQYQATPPPKPNQGAKTDDSGAVVIVVTDQTDVITPEPKGMPSQGPVAVKPPKVKPVPPRQDDTPAEPTQGPKVKPVKPRQDEQAQVIGVNPAGPSSDGAPAAGPIQGQISKLKPGQMVRVVYQQQAGQQQATQVRVLQVQQAPPRD